MTRAYALARHWHESHRQRYGTFLAGRVYEIDRVELGFRAAWWERVENW